MGLEVMMIDRTISVKSCQDPLEKLIIVRVTQLDMKPLGPTFEPTIGTLHVGITTATIYFSSSSLDLKNYKEKTSI